MSDSYRIVGLAGRGAVSSAASNGEERFEPFLADLVLWPDGAAEPDLSQVAQAAAEALSWHHENLRARADAVALAVLAVGAFTAVEVTVQRPESQLGVPVLGVEVTVRRPVKTRSHQESAEIPRVSEVAAPTPGRTVSAEAGPVRNSVAAALPMVPVVASAAPVVAPAPAPAPAVPVPAVALPDVAAPAHADAEWPPAPSGSPVPVPVWPSVSGSSAQAGAEPVAESGSAAQPVVEPEFEPEPEFAAEPQFAAESEFEAVSEAQPAFEPELEPVPAEPVVDSEPLSPSVDATLSADGALNAEAGSAAALDPDLDSAAALDSAADPDADPTRLREVTPESEIPWDRTIPASQVAEAGLVQGAPVTPAAVAESVLQSQLGFAPPASDFPAPIDDPEELPAEDHAFAEELSPSAVADINQFADEAPVAPTFAMARRPSVDAPLPALLVLTGTGARAKEELTGAVGAVASAAGIDLDAVSPLARTPVAGGDTHTAVVRVRTTLEPAALAQALRDAVAHRDGVKADLLSVEGMVGTFDGIDLPLPGAASRASVLVPWAQLEPTAVLPGLGGGPVVVLAETAPDREAVRWLALDWT